MKFIKNEKVLVDIEPLVANPENWVEATYIKRGYHDVCLVEIEGVLYTYPEKLIKKISE